MNEYAEEWTVQVGKETFVLDEIDMAILKKAYESGERGILFFDKFAISIPFISSMYRTKRYLKNPPKQLEEPERVYTPEEMEANRKRLDEIRAKLGKKLKS